MIKGKRIPPQTQPTPNPLNWQMEKMLKEMRRKKMREELRKKVKRQRYYDRLLPKVTSPGNQTDWVKVKKEMKATPIRSSKVWI